MNHSREQLEALISAYLDDELTPEERADVEALLARDSAARALFADFQAMRGALQSLPRARASADMMEAIRARMERQALLGDTRAAAHQPRRALSTTGRWAAAAAVVLMTSVGGYVIWNLNSRESLTTPNQQVAALDRKGEPARPSAGNAPDTAERYTEAVPDKRDQSEVTTLADTYQTPSQERAYYGVETPSGPAASPAVPLLTAQAKVDENDGVSLNQPVPQAGRELSKEKEKLKYAYKGEPLESKNDAVVIHPLSPGLAGTATAVATPPPAQKPYPPAETEIVTVACNDARARDQVVQQVRSHALLVTDLGRPAARRTESAARPQGSVQPRYDLSLQQAPAAGLSEMPARLRGREHGRVTDLLVVVPDEKSRDSLVKRFTVPVAGAAGFGEAKAGPADSPTRGMGQAGQRVRTSGGRTQERGDTGQAADRRLGGYAVPQSRGATIHAGENSPAKAGTRPALPQDSIVFRRGAEGRQAGQEHERVNEGTEVASAHEETHDDFYSDRDHDGEQPPATTEPAPTQKRISLEAFGDAVWNWAARSPSSQPAEKAARVEPAAAPEEYVVRLHISVRPPDSQPVIVTAGERFVPATQPAEAVRFDPSVLDLRARAKPAAPTSAPATRP